MRFSARFWRSTCLLACVVALAFVLAVGALSPARAQFFFPFFDNRPTVRPNVDLRPRRQRADVDLRPRRQRADIDLRPRRQRGEVEVRAHRPRRDTNADRTAKRSHERPGRANEKTVEPAKPAVEPPVAEGPPPPYEPQLLRLSELMGALAWLQTICATPAAAEGIAQVKAPPKASDDASAGDAPWRERMEILMTAEAAGPARREKLAGAYNHGMQGYQFSYRVCTPSAMMARRRFLDEGARLAHEISTQYRAY
jgi:predicted secreted protein